MTSLKKLLGGSAARPIGSHVWFPMVDNPEVNPIYATNGREYLRSGYIIIDDPKYEEALDLFGITYSADKKAIGIPDEVIQGSTIKYMRIL